MKPMYFFLITLMCCCSCQMSHDTFDTPEANSLRPSAAPSFYTLKVRSASKTYHLLSVTDVPSEVPSLLSTDIFPQVQDAGYFQLMDDAMLMSDLYQNAEDCLARTKTVAELVHPYHIRLGFLDNAHFILWRNEQTYLRPFGPRSGYQHFNPNKKNKGNNLI